jgi:hypothetical protein
MRSTPILLASLSLAVAAAAAAACGGTSKAGRAASPGGEGDDPATPFSDGAVKAAVAATPGVAACSVEPSTTMGAHLEAQRTMLKAGDATQPTTESFMCRAQANDNWECEWSVFADYSAAPAAGGEPAEGEANPCGEEDPCGGEAGSGYVIVFTVRNDGTLVPGSMSCHAPG